MAFVSLKAALLTTLSADLDSYNDPGQAALELATVTGFGAVDHPNVGNSDVGDYVAVAYYEIGTYWYPVTVLFRMTGPQGSLGGVVIDVPFIPGYDDLTINDLAATGLWSDGRAMLATRA